MSIGRYLVRRYLERQTFIPSNEKKTHKARRCHVNFVFERRPNVSTSSHERLCFGGAQMHRTRGLVSRFWVEPMAQQPPELQPATQLHYSASQPYPQARPLQAAYPPPQQLQSPQAPHAPYSPMNGHPQQGYHPAAYMAGPTPPGYMKPPGASYTAAQFQPQQQPQPPSSAGPVHAIPAYPGGPSPNYGSGYVPQPSTYLPGAYPPPLPGPAYPEGLAIGSPQACQHTREELNEHLQESQYGANYAIFSCYFIRDSPNGPPLCSTCRMPIGNHEAGSGGGTVLIGTNGSAIVVPDNVATGPPSGLITNAEYDTIETKPHFMLFIVVFGFIAIGTIQLIAFAGSGLWRLNPGFMAIPVFVICVGIASLMLIKWTTIRFYKDGHGPASRVEVETWRVLTLCCHDVQVATIRDVRGLGIETITYRNRPPISTIRVHVNNDVVPLYAGSLMDASVELGRWQNYFRDNFGHSGM